MNARRARALLAKLEAGLPALPGPAHREDPVDWQAVTVALLEGSDGQGLDEASRKAFVNLLPYAGVIRDFARQQGGPEEARQDPAGPR